MTHLSLMRRAFVCAALAAASGLSHASLSFSWSLLDWNPVVTGNEAVKLHAQIYNDASSSEKLLGSRLLQRSADGIADAYAFADALPGLNEQLQNMVLDPGQGFDFLFGLLLPINGPLPPGSYYGGGFALSFADDAGGVVSWSPDRNLLIEVREGEGQPLPEPATPALMLLAAGAAWLVRQRRQR